MAEDTPSTGHNSNSALHSLAERVERLNEEKKAIAEDIRGIFAEAKSNGFHIPALRGVLRDRAKNKDKRDDYEANYDIYRASLGF